MSKKIFYLLIAISNEYLAAFKAVTIIVIPVQKQANKYSCAYLSQRSAIGEAWEFLLQFWIYANQFVMKKIFLCGYKISGSNRFFCNACSDKK